MSYGAELPLLSPVRLDPSPVQQVKDLTEYVAEQVRRDLYGFLHDSHTRNRQYYSSHFTTSNATAACMAHDEAQKDGVSREYRYHLVLHLSVSLSRCNV